MQDFKTRFNYFAFSIILIGFIASLVLLSIGVVYGSSIFHILAAKEKNKVAMYIGLSMVPLGVLWMTFFLGRILKKYRFILVFKQDSIILKDAIFLTSKEFLISDIDGYVDTIYFGDLLMRCTIIFLKDGRSIRVLNFLTSNFDHLKLALKGHRIKKLLH